MNRTLEHILPKVQKPARYTGGEYNAIVKDRRTVDTRYARPVSICCLWGSWTGDGCSGACWPGCWDLPGHTGSGQVWTVFSPPGCSFLGCSWYALEGLPHYFSLPAGYFLHCVRKREEKGVVISGGNR